MFSYGFYDSKEGDRKYNAEQMSSIFDGIIEDGVYSNVGEALMVVPGTGLQVIVKTGRAWFKHTWSLNDAYLPLSIETADVYRGRIDAVVLEINKNLDVRANEIKVVKGTAATSPTKPVMKHEEDIDQYALAYITVDAEADAIVESKIEIAVGKNETPFVQCPLKTVSIEDLFNQWQGEFDEWFSNVKAQLEGDVVTNLQNQIDARVRIADKATEEDVKNKVPNKWLDAPLLANPDRYLAEPGGIIESVEDLEEIDPDHWARCDQREMPISRIGKDLGRLPYANAVAPAVAINPIPGKKLFGTIKHTENRVYLIDTASRLCYFTTDNPNVRNVVVPAPSTTSPFLMTDSFIIVADKNGNNILVTRYSLDGAIEKKHTISGSSNNSLIIGSIGNRIIILPLRTNLQNIFSGQVIYSDDAFDSYHTANTLIDGNCMLYGYTEAYLPSYYSIDEPFAAFMQKDSTENLYIALRSVDNNKIILYRSHDGVNWIEYKRIEHSAPYFIWGIVDDKAHVLLSYSGQYSKKHFVIDLTTNKLDEYPFENIIKDNSVYGEENKNPDWITTAQSKIYRYGKLYVYSINKPDIMVADLERSEWYIIYDRFYQLETSLSFCPMPNGDLIIDCRFTTNVGDPMSNIYDIELRNYNKYYRCVHEYIRITKDGIKIYPIFSILQMWTSAPDSSPVSYIYHPFTKSLYVIRSETVSNTTGCRVWRIDASKNMLPYAPGKYIRLNPPETQ